MDVNFKFLNGPLARTALVARVPTYQNTFSLSNADQINYGRWLVLVGLKRSVGMHRLATSACGKAVERSRGRRKRMDKGMTGGHTQQSVAHSLERSLDDSMAQFFSTSACELLRTLASYSLLYYSCPVLSCPVLSCV